VKARAHVFISGRVQGVFFRYRTREKAYEQDVVGWTRNLPDGRVEAVFEGERANVEKIISFCRRGPPGAIVRDIKIIWEEPTGEFRDFRVH